MRSGGNGKGAPKVGVLALQGAFEAHERALERAGAQAVPVRTAAELEGIDALVIPGGESTTMLKIAGDEGLLEPLRRFCERRPVFGTCAGAILLAAEVENPPQPSLGLVDVTIRRNAYGRQVDSHVARLPFGDREFEAVFIRAPRILRAGPGVEVHLTYKGDPVLVSQGNRLIATFHPELSGDPGIHRMFLDTLKV